MPREVPFVLACVLASLVLQLAAFVAPVRRASCPAGWWMPYGARDGLVRCWRKPTGDNVRNARGFLVDTGIEPPGEIDVQLACGGDSVRQDGMSAWCDP